MIDISAAIRVAIAMEQMQPPVTIADLGLLYDAEAAIKAQGLGPACLAMDKAGTLDRTFEAAGKVLADARVLLANPARRPALLGVLGAL